ncbi:hypothetical protein BaRGS_00009697, partial [Batillaria attramentaria]
APRTERDTEFLLRDGRVALWTQSMCTNMKTEKDTARPSLRARRVDAQDANERAAGFSSSVADLTTQGPLQSSALAWKPCFPRSSRV